MSIFPIRAVWMDAGVRDAGDSLSVCGDVNFKMSRLHSPTDNVHTAPSAQLEKDRRSCIGINSTVTTSRPQIVPDFNRPVRNENGRLDRKD